jgi:hypothetical protein
MEGIRVYSDHDDQIQEIIDNAIVAIGLQMKDLGLAGTVRVSIDLTKDSSTR